MTPEQTAIIDAAIDIVVFSKTHEWPPKFSPEFFEFADKLNQLEGAVNTMYPKFGSNITARTKPTSTNNVI